MSVIEAADLFCGAGGTSCGLMRAADALGLKVKLTAVNHWPRAVATHSLNHPSSRHLCAALSSIEPRKAVPSGRLRLLLASPECTHHSVARGGKPMNDQSRASAWHVLHWCEELRVDDVVIENVKEFQDWGPLGADGKPLKSKKGELFKSFIDALNVTFKHVEWKVLNAADYGDATSRRRLFIRASRKPIVWPEPSHMANADGSKPAHRAAREIIDWNIRGTSIFRRKRPLKAATLARIAAGIRKFWGAWAEPFLVILRNNQDAQGMGGPVPTLTTSGANVGVCEPMILSAGGPRVDAIPTSKPFNTVLTRDHMAVVQPFILPQMTTLDAWGLAQPFMVQACHGGGEDRRVHSVEQPVPTMPCSNRFGVVAPFLVEYYGQGGARALSEPMQTVTTRDRAGLLTPYIVPVSDPSAVAPFLLNIGGEWYWLDLLFRMLQPHELAAAMGFAKSYEFTGTREERVKQIGNAVAVNMAAALCRSVLEKTA